MCSRARLGSCVTVLLGLLCWLLGKHYYRFDSYTLVGSAHLADGVMDLCVSSTRLHSRFGVKIQNPNQTLIRMALNSQHNDILGELYKYKAQVHTPRVIGSCKMQTGRANGEWSTYCTGLLKAYSSTRTCIVLLVQVLLSSE
jgi:hypothetical protein